MRNDSPGGYPAITASSGASAAASAAKFEIHTILIALRCWWKISLPLGVLLAAATGSVVYYLFEPTYTASAWVEIKERPQQVLAAPSEASRTFVDNQIQLMRSPYLVSKLLANAEIKNTPEVVGAEDQLTALIAGIVVKRQGQSDFYTISFTSKSAVKAALIVNSLAAEFKKDFVDYEMRRRQELTGILSNLRSAKAVSVEQSLLDAKSAAEQANVQFKDPVLGTPQSTPMSAEEAELSLIMSELRHADSQVIILQADYEAQVAAAANPAEDAPSGVVDRFLQEDGLLLQKEQELERAKVLCTEYERTLAESKRATSPRLIQLKQDVARLEKELADQTAQRREAILSELAQGMDRHRRDSLAALKKDLDRALVLQQTWKTKYDETVKQLPAKGGANSVDLRIALDKYDREYSVHEDLSKSLEAMSMNSLFVNDRVTLRSEAEVPRAPVEVLPFKKIGVFAGAALCLPFALAIAWEHFFRRVNSRQQLETSGALKVVGEITALPRRSRRSAKSQTSRELQLFEESVDGLRTYLSLVETLQGLRVLCVTSAVSREGKTSVASQLAVSIAGATGEPTLLIDGDLRSPDIHRIFGVDLSPGLAEVLSGELSDDEAIETDFNETLHLMTAGKLNSSPHRLLGSGEFKALLERLRGVYRYIVIDTPPLLAASEALILARAADAAILAARRDFSRLDQVTEAYARLNSASVSFAGVVLNGIPIRHYAYKYGSYGYRRRMAMAD